jgi:hypothetical protein
VKGDWPPEASLAPSAAFLPLRKLAGTTPILMVLSQPFFRQRHAVYVVTPT